MFPITKAEWITRKRSNQRSDELWWPILAQVASSASRFSSPITLGIIVFFKFMSSTSMLEVYNLRYMGNRCIGIIYP